VYPNPTNDQFKVKHTSHGILDITIFDHTGREVKKINADQPSMDISDIPQGLYFIHIKFSNKTVIKQIIKS
jgi:hypothetical protein